MPPSAASPQKSTPEFWRRSRILNANGTTNCFGELAHRSTNAASLTAENVNWNSRTLVCQRRKTRSRPHFSIGRRLEGIIKASPATHLLFPKIATISDKHRSAEFWRRCHLLGIKAVLGDHGLRGGD